MELKVNLALSLCSFVNFDEQFYLREWEDKFNIVIFFKVHFVMIHIFDFCISENSFVHNCRRRASNCQT